MSIVNLPKWMLPVYPPAEHIVTSPTFLENAETFIQQHPQGQEAAESDLREMVTECYLTVEKGWAEYWRDDSLAEFTAADTGEDAAIWAAQAVDHMGWVASCDHRLDTARQMAEFRRSRMNAEAA